METRKRGTTHLARPDLCRSVPALTLCEHALARHTPRRHLNETVSARGGVRVRIVERASRWMAAEELAGIVADLQAIVASAIPGGDLAYGAASGDPERLDATILTIAYNKDGRAIAFNALALMDCELRGQEIEVLHLGLVVIDPAARASGLAGVLYGLPAFLLFARRQMRPLWISNVTQVPAPVMPSHRNPSRAGTAPRGACTIPDAAHQNSHGRAGRARVRLPVVSSGRRARKPIHPTRHDHP